MNHRSFGFSTQRNASRRGTVIVLAIGLLMIIVMLGSTFLILSRMDSQQSAALAPSAAVPPIAEGLMKTVAAQLKADLYIKDTGTPANDRVYGLFTGVNTDWRGYVDYPRSWVTSEGIAMTRIRPDLLLAGVPTANPNNKVNFTNVSNIDNDNNLTPMPAYASPVQFQYITFSGGYLNWWLNATTLSGVSIVDPKTSLPYQGVSTSGDVFPTGSGYLPALVGTPIPDAVITDTLARDNDGNQYWAAVRVVGIDAVNPNVLNLADTLALQPYRATRSLPRSLSHYMAGMPIRKLDDTFLTVFANAGSAAVHKALYDMLIDAGAGADEAGHFVANLMAKRYSGADWQSKAFEFNNGSKTYYGVVPQLVITEVFAHSKPETAIGSADNEYAYAMEIANLTGGNLDLGNYKLDYGGSSWDFSSMGAVANSFPHGGRIVLFDCDSIVPRNTYGFPNNNGLNGGAYWYNVSGLDFSGGKEAKLIRVIGTDIPIDEASGSDIGYTVTTKETDAASTKDGRRDDNPDHGRFLIPYYDLTLGSGPADHRLGQDNGATIADTDVLKGFKLLAPSGASFTHLSELFDLYIVGPDSNNKSLPKQLYSERTNLGGGRPNLIAGTIASPAARYPDAPWPALLAEIFDFSEIKDEDGNGTIDPLETKHAVGKLNINTVTREILVDWLGVLFAANAVELDFDGGGTDVTISGTSTTEIGQIADYILAYRDFGSTTAPAPNNFSSGRAGVGGLPGNLRQDVASNAIPGFLTPGELAIPLGLYSKDLAGSVTITNGDALKKLYFALADYITTHSDTFGVYITIQLRDPDGMNFDPVRQWNYFGIVDRSTCRTADSQPVIHTFFERD